MPSKQEILEEVGVKLGKPSIVITGWVANRESSELDPKYSAKVAELVKKYGAVCVHHALSYLEAEANAKEWQKRMKESEDQLLRHIAEKGESGIEAVL